MPACIHYNFIESKITMILVWLSLFLLLHPTHAEEINLLLKDGRNVSGEIDAQSNEKEIWLIQKTPRIILKSGFQWNDIQTVLQQGKEISQSDLLKVISKIEKQNPEVVQNYISQFWLSDVVLPELNFNQESRKDLQDFLPELNDRSLKIASIEMEAYIANWDSDAEMDGLIVQLYPLNNQGQIIQVDGQASFKLFGQRFNRGVDRRRADRIPFPELGNWTKQVEYDDYNSDGIRLKLEFHNFHPDVQTHLADESLLTASFGVPGQGKFYASAADVFIRNPSRYRDELYQNTRYKSRFHPKESIRRHWKSNGSILFPSR